MRVIERTRQASGRLSFDLGQEDCLELLAIGLTMGERPDRVFTSIEHILCIIKGDDKRRLCVCRHRSEYRRRPVGHRGRPRSLLHGRIVEFAVVARKETSSVQASKCQSAGSR
jgi:hypothetical protein